MLYLPPILSSRAPATIPWQFSVTIIRQCALTFDSVRIWDSESSLRSLEETLNISLMNTKLNKWHRTLNISMTVYRLIPIHFMFIIDESPGLHVIWLAFGSYTLSQGMQPTYSRSYFWLSCKKNTIIQQTFIHIFRHSWTCFNFPLVSYKFIEKRIFTKIYNFTLKNFFLIRGTS